MGFQDPLIAVPLGLCFGPWGYVRDRLAFDECFAYDLALMDKIRQEPKPSKFGSVVRRLMQDSVHQIYGGFPKLGVPF